MRTVTEKTIISFGKLSDLGAVRSSGFARSDIKLWDFSQEAFSYLVQNIVEMYGLDPDTIDVRVESNDVAQEWTDYNNNGRIDDGEVVFRFTMNANINPYTRISTYGQHYMYIMAQTYGYPVIFGIAAHEIGHLINHYSLCQFEQRRVGGFTAIIQTSAINARWDELCADYQAGIIMAMASPRLDHKPLMNMLAGTNEDEAHPDGYWRVMAIDMGYQWACAHSPLLNSRILTTESTRSGILSSFMSSFYDQVYNQVSRAARRAHSRLSDTFIEPVNELIGYI